MMVVALILSATDNIIATPICELNTSQYTSTKASHPEPTQPTFELQRPALGLTTINHASQGVTPAVRTLPRSVNHTPRCEVSSATVRSIDSTLSARRYGLYNHKILFYAHPRHYYLNGLMRLII